MPAQENTRRILVVEAQRELRGIKDGLGLASYTQTLQRLKLWRLLFLRVDFEAAVDLGELDVFMVEYRAIRELLQWRIDMLQKPALKQIRRWGEIDLQGALGDLRQEVTEKTYEFEDREEYLRDLEFLVTREYLRLKHGENSPEFLRYKTAAGQLQVLQERSAQLLKGQQEVWSRKRAQLLGEESYG